MNFGILKIIRDSEQFHNISRYLRDGINEVQLYGMPEGLKSIWLTAMLMDFKPILVITSSVDEAQRLAVDMESYWPGEGIDYLPPAELIPHEVHARSHEVTAQRLQALINLVNGRTRVLVVPVDVLLTKLTPPEKLLDSLLNLETGRVIDREELIKQFIHRGYRREEVVETPGQLSIRGGIIDIFPVGSEMPVRLELFGDEIDSIRVFNPQNQRSVSEIRAITVGPAQEIIPPDNIREKLALVKDELDKTYERLSKTRPQGARELKERIQGLVNRVESGIWPEGMRQLQAFFYPLASIFDYFQTPPVVILDDPVRLYEDMHQREQLRLHLFTEMFSSGTVLPSQMKAYLQTSELKNILKNYQRLYLSLLPRKIPSTNPRALVSVGARTIPAFQGKMSLLIDELSHWRREGFRTIIMVADPNRVAALRNGLAEQGIASKAVKEVSEVPEQGQVIILPGRLRQGFSWPELQLSVLGDNEIYGSVRRPRRVRTTGEGTKITSFADLQEGDYVVHVHHGIGRYLGLKQLETGGVKKDYLFIQYAGKDRLYVPVDQVYLVQKYIGSEGHIPKLYRLGGNEWNKVKSRVQEAVREMAEELLQLYAKRAAIPGFGFSPDTPWQREFEEAFPYTETPDQLKAIKEVKADMESPRVMDRLLCGDVGYGKTEVAMRGAFKAVMDGKQVAVLVPTTVLAQQHFNTFKQRFAPFPIKVEVLSRFRSYREQSAIVKKLSNGEIDIIIGTHRLLSRDVSFKNLGLVVVDEEQRFGVAHKEKLKRLCYNVDVLTMTATPIPRTLQMAIAGVRSMSLIETPPEDRFPVQTYVVEYSPELVREAIRKELSRKGQVYYVHNRVYDIDSFAYYIQQLVPEAKIGIGHGRMSERELEKVMLDFIDGQYDVLVCTTIVENGLDIPNVNTLIVDESDSFGLAQLYQLRGRVGRANRIAYAYFTYRPDKVLGEVAEKRLAAIREFTAFGSGYKIALRDLQIRGAGNILGPEQHGHILTVGFDLYCQLLEETVHRLKKQRGEMDQETKKVAAPVIPVELYVDTFISDEYIPQAAIKMEIYTRLMAAKEMSEIKDIAEEMKDRFGLLPLATRNLLSLSRVRLLAQEIGVISIQQKDQVIELNLGHHANLRGEKLLQLSQYFPRKLSFSSTGGLIIKIKIQGLDQTGLLTLLEEMLTRIRFLTVEAVS